VVVHAPLPVCLLILASRPHDRNCYVELFATNVKTVPAAMTTPPPLKPL
jgi:hypothetical protein